jgi:hypothetical protein
VRQAPARLAVKLGSLHIQPQLTLGLFLFSVGIGRWNAAGTAHVELWVVVTFTKKRSMLRRRPRSKKPMGFGCVIDVRFRGYAGRRSADAPVMAIYRHFLRFMLPMSPVGQRMGSKDMRDPRSGPRTSSPPRLLSHRHVFLVTVHRQARLFASATSPRRTPVSEPTDESKSKHHNNEDFDKRNHDTIGV